MKKRIGKRGPYHRWVNGKCVHCKVKQARGIPPCKKK